jgi:hypothetical protein
LNPGLTIGYGGDDPMPDDPKIGADAGGEAVPVAASVPASRPTPARTPASLCGYPVDAVLASTQAAEPGYLGPSYLAVGPGGRGVVLKPLDPDCLFKSGLHPSIKERLARVREMALGGVANLYGVERDRPPAVGATPEAVAGPWLIWEHVRGRPFDEYAADPARTRRSLAAVARELVLAVEALHRKGVVHGAIRGSNAIVDARGAVRLTHVSPLLYTDPGDDLWGVLTMLADAAGGPADDDGSVARLVAETRAWADGAAGPAPAADAVLRSLAVKLAALADARGPAGPPPAPAEAAAEAAPRRRSLAGAAAALLVGGGAALALWWLVRQPAGPVAGWVHSAWDARR